MFKADDLSDFLIETKQDAIEILDDFFDDLYRGFSAHITFDKLLKIMVKDYNFQNDNDRIQLSEEFENDLELDDYKVSETDQSVSPMEFERYGLTSARDLLLANGIDINQKNNWVFIINYLRLRHVLREILLNAFGLDLNAYIDEISLGNEETNMNLISTEIENQYQAIIDDYNSRLA